MANCANTVICCYACVKILSLSNCKHLLWWHCKKLSCREHIKRHLKLLLPEKNLFQMRVFYLLPFLHTCELKRPPEVFKASLKLLFFAWLLIYLHNIKLESPPLSNCHFPQVFRFGLPEKLGTGQDGPDFLQWEGWKGGVMPKQVLFCLGWLYDTPVLTKEYFFRWVSASICATLPWILGVKARRESCVSFR